MTMNKIQDTIIEEMSSLTEWFDKYEQLIKLGRRLEPMDDSDKCEENQIKGCQSQVWMTAGIVDGRLHLTADSDSLITKGIISLLLRVLNGQMPRMVLSEELYFVREIGLSTNLSPSRANGLALIIQQIKKYAGDFSQA
ncbi:MAG: SufE family protein [Proteobacteria bacterium]|nr:SufE family protein [Pseudomonadota bacterium]